MGKILDSLVDFASDHFNKEEELLEKYKFPEFEDRRDQRNSVFVPWLAQICLSTKVKPVF